MYVVRFHDLDMSKKLILLLLLICSFSSTLFAARVRGLVVDSSDTPLTGVTTQVFALPDSVRKAYMITNAKGVFSFKSIAPGNYMLKLSMVGMDDLSQVFSVADTTKTLDLGTIRMSETAVMLADAVITGVKAAVVAKVDTVEFNAGSFKTQANATVEDLLKKLPGVEVGTDGSITSNGKTITKVLVDGKEFFGEDTKMATKNLPSDLVDKVQVVDRKSDLARITGVDDGEEETVINLTVKKNMKNGWFGTVNGGYGTDKRYEGKFNVSTFTDNNQISIVGGANNINDMGFQDSGRGRFSSFGNSGGITKSEQLGINFNVGKTDKFRVGGNVFYTHSNTFSETEKNTIKLYEDGSSTENISKSNSTDIGHNVKGDFRMEWKIDPNNTLDFRPSFSFNKRNTELIQNSDLFNVDADHSHVNSNYSKRFNHGTSYNAAGRLIFNHNFASRPGRSFSVQADYEFSDTKQHSTTWSDIEFYQEDKHGVLKDPELLYRFLDNHQWNNQIGARLTWTEPLGDVKRGNFLQIAYRMNLKFNNADKDTYNLNDVPGINVKDPQDFDILPVGSIFDTDLSNSFRNKFSSQQLQIGYKKVTRDYNLEAGVNIAPSSSGSENLINSDKNVKTRWTWNYAPFMRLRYKLSKTKSIRLDYRARTSQPSINQLQPVADVSDPLHITQGNPDLKPTFNQSLSFNFSNFNQDTQQSIMAMLRGQYSNNVVVNNTTTDKDGVSRTTYENANGNMNAFGMFMINQPFRNKKLRYGARLFSNFASTAGYNNGNFNRSGNLRVSPSVSFTFTNDVFQFNVRPTYSFSMATSTLKKQPTRKTHSYGFRSDASLYLPFGLQLNTDLDFDNKTGLSQGYNAASWLWNAQISYSFLKGKALTVSVRAYDILQQKKNISRSVSDSEIIDSRYNDLTRYVMFGISYTFNTLKNKKKPEQEGDFLHPEHGDRPRGPRPSGGGGYGRRH